MDINKKMLDMSAVINLPVEEDDYEGPDSEFVVFTYADERAGMYGDDKPLLQTATMTVKAVLNKSTDYFEIKDKIWKYILGIGGYGVSYQSYIERVSNNKKVRNLIFDFNIDETEV